MEIDESTTQHRVRWTDPTGERIRRATDEADAKRIATRQAEHGAVIEAREIVVGEWEVAT